MKIFIQAIIQEVTLPVDVEKDVVIICALCMVYFHKNYHITL
jgi:hypothetical protein